MKFSKMHGLGNDFILLDRMDAPPEDYHHLAQTLCDRHLGIGADGIEIALPSDQADIRMRIINSDGSEAEMCGNGIRCFAKFVYEKGIVAKQRMTVETFAGIIRPELIIENGQVTQVRVDMGKPIRDRKAIPMNGPEGPVISEMITMGQEQIEITSMLMAVPHTMVFVDDLNRIAVEQTGPMIENHSLFPKRTNVNFVQVLNENEIKVKTWERGAGATLACGTGCCAAVVAAVLNGKTGRHVTVHLKVGDLNIEWLEDETVLMTGPAVEVFTGEFVG